jgi:hypothetical protein
MTKLIKSRTAQYPLVAEFTFNASDSIANTSGVDTSFNATALVADIAPIPVGATVVGGEVVVETVYNTVTTATISIGDSGSATRYATTADLKSAARTALTLTGYRYAASDNLRVTLALSDSAAGNVGKVTVRLMYTLDGRQNENNV